MTRLRQAAYLVFLICGSCVIIAPVLRELNPWNFFLGQLDLLQFIALELFLALVVFWTLKASQTKSLPSFLGAIFCAGLSGGIGLWMARFFGTDAAIFLDATPVVILAAGATILLILVAVRQAAGLALVGIVTAMLCFGVLGQYLPWTQLVLETDPTSYLIYVVYGSDGLFGLALDIISNVVLIFVIFGVAFEISGGGEVIRKVALRLAMHSRKGAIKACVIASGLFGTVSGTAISNVLTSGTFSIPSMRRIGVRNETAAGIEAAASTCGQIMPPVLGATAFFLANFVGIPYSSVVLASIGPALICYYAFFRQADSIHLDVMTTFDDPEEITFERSELLYLVPIAGMFALLLQSSAYVSLAAIVGSALCLMVSLLRQGTRATLHRIQHALPELIRTCINLVLIAAAIGLLLGALYSTGLTVTGALMIGQLGESSLLLALVLTALAAFVLGLGVATVGVYILTATLLAPGLIFLGVPTLAAHYFVLLSGILSMITPPVALASLAASTLAKADFMKTAWQAMRFGWILFVLPFLVVFQPGLLLIGDWAEIFWAFVISLAFVYAATDVRLPIWVKAAAIVLTIFGIVGS